jgi:hypothetical protein
MRNAFGALQLPPPIVKAVAPGRTLVTFIRRSSGGLVHFKRFILDHFQYENPLTEPLLEPGRKLQGLTDSKITYN